MSEYIQVDRLQLNLTIMQRPRYQHASERIMVVDIERHPSDGSIEVSTFPASLPEIALALMAWLSQHEDCKHAVALRDQLAQL